MKKYRPKQVRSQGKRHYHLILNRKASGFSLDAIKKLTTALTGAGFEYHEIDSDNIKEVIFQIKRTLPRRPSALIACGGDGTVNLVGRQLIRRTCPLGIFPLGKTNNIFRSLYGDVNQDTAINHILAGTSRQIDQGLAFGRFFLGSVGVGLIPRMHEQLENKRLPRFGIGWSRLAAQSAASIEARELSIKVDSFAFDLMPTILNINLMTYTNGLALTPASLYDDGKCEIVFDIGRGQAVISKFIRQIHKKKYLYSDDIRMYRGTRIAIRPVEGMQLYIDGDITDIPSDELKIQIFPKRIRVLHRDSTKQ